MKRRLKLPVWTLHCWSLSYPNCVSFFKLLVVMDRIRGFPLSSPISKLLNGLEILLAKAQVRSFLLPCFSFWYFDKISLLILMLEQRGKIWFRER